MIFRGIKFPSSYKSVCCPNQIDILANVSEKKKDKMEEGSGVLLKFLLPSGCDELSVTQALHEAWERCSEAGLSLSWMEEETVLKLKSPVSEKVNKSNRHFT